MRRESLALGRAAPAELGDAAARFRGVLARHCALALAPREPGATEDDRAKLAAILARPEFRSSGPDRRALRRAILALWTRLLEVLGTSEAERYASVGRAAFLAAVAAAVALVAAALRRRRRGPPPTRRPPAPPAGAARAGATARDAAEALARGDAREAVRRSMLAAIGALERAGRVPAGRALTNGEIVEAAGASLAAELAPLARLFDAAVYGGRPVRPEDARAAVGRAMRLEALAAGGGP